MTTSYRREGNHWIFDTGEILPVVSGGSDDWMPTDIIPNQDDNANDDASLDEVLSDFAQGILNQIPEDDRPVVQKYMKTWDGNVTKKFQEYSGKLKPYEELGPVEELQQALTWIQLLNEDPIVFIDKVKTTLKELGHPSMTDTNDNVDLSSLPEFEGIPPEFVQKYTSLESNFNSLNSKLDQFLQQTELEKAASQFDNLMKEMHTKHGDFDEDWMLVQMQKGVNPDDAAKKWKSDIVEKYSSPRKPAPNILNGNGSVPSSQVDISKMSSAERKAYAVKQLMLANGKDV